MPICSEPVPLYDFGGGHLARCFLYDARAEGQKTIPAPNVPAIPNSAVARSPQGLAK
jgi:hypothetical protein